MYDACSYAARPTGRINPTAMKWHSDISSSSLNYYLENASDEIIRAYLPSICLSL